MLIALSAMAADQAAQLSSQFGRCPYFVLFDTATGEWTAKPNPAAEAGGGAGTQAAQFVVQQGVGAAISGQFGPKAEQVLRTAGVELYAAAAGSVSEAVEAYQGSRLAKFS